MSLKYEPATEPLHISAHQGLEENPGKGNPTPHGARPVHPIITMLKWIRTKRLSVKNSLCKKVKKPWSRRLRIAQTLFVFFITLEPRVE